MISIPRRVVVKDTHLNANPHLEGTRLTVFDIVSACKHEGINAVLEESGDLTTSALRSVLRYCEARCCDQDMSHCGGCSLRSEQDGISSEEDFVNRFAKVRFTRSDKVLKGSGQGVVFMSGSPEDLHGKWRGEDGWRIASELLKELSKG